MSTNQNTGEYGQNGDATLPTINEEGVPDRTPLVERSESTPLSSLEVQVLTGNSSLIEETEGDAYFDPLAAYVVEEHVGDKRENEGSENSVSEIVHENTSEKLSQSSNLEEDPTFIKKSDQEDVLHDPFAVTEEDFINAHKDVVETPEGTYSLSLVKGVAKVEFKPNEIRRGETEVRDPTHSPASSPSAVSLESEDSQLQPTDASSSYDQKEDISQTALSLSFREIMEKERLEMAQKLGLKRPNPPSWKKPMIQSSAPQSVAESSPKLSESIASTEEMPESYFTASKPPEATQDQSTLNAYAAHSYPQLETHETPPKTGLQFSAENNPPQTHTTESTRVNEDAETRTVDTHVKKKESSNRRKLVRMRRSIRLLDAIEVLTSVKLDPISTRLAKLLHKRVLKSLESDIKIVAATSLNEGGEPGDPFEAQELEALEEILTNKK